MNLLRIIPFLLLLKSLPGVHIQAAFPDSRSLRCSIKISVRLVSARISHIESPLEKLGIFRKVDRNSDFAMFLWHDLNLNSEYANFVLFLCVNAAGIKSIRERQETRNIVIAGCLQLSNRQISFTHHRTSKIMRESYDLPRDINASQRIRSKVYSRWVSSSGQYILKVVRADDLLSVDFSSHRFPRPT